MTAVAVREHPILFSAPMVRAILEDRKCVTRRVVKLLPSAEHSHKLGPGQGWMLLDNGRFMAKCPYEVGDRLWVRETFGLDNKEYVKTYKHEAWRGQPDPSSAQVFYRDSEHDLSIFPPGYWKPSIFMPRWASRITLEIEDVRVERVQEITEDGAKAEGCAPVIIDGFVECGTRKTTFRALWDSINEKRGYGWDVNPWVWAITFRRIET